MATIISTKTSGVGGLEVTGDATGILQLASNNGTTAVTVDASQNVGIGTASPTRPLSVLGNSSTYNLVSFSSSAAETNLELVNTGTNGRAWNLIAGGNGGAFSSGQFGIYDATAGAARLAITSAGLLQFNSGYGSVATAYGCRAWVNFNGTGTVAIRASGNVTSITDNGTGDYTVNFTTAMPDTNYATSVEGQGTNTANLALGMSIMGTSTGGAAFRAPTTSGFRFGTWTSNFSGQADSAIIMVSVFR